MNYYKNKSALITGAASGIGLSLARELSKNNCSLALCDCDIQGLRRLKETLSCSGIIISVHHLDVSDKDQMLALPEEVLKNHKRIDFLFNNAGVALSANIDEMKYEDFEWLMNINLMGTIYGTKAFLSHLKKHKSHIINVSSVFGLFSLPTQSAYNCSKFAVRGFTEALSQELINTNISVSCVIPGGIRTNIVKNARVQNLPGNIANRDDAATRFQQLARTSPEKAATIILTGVAKKKTRILVGPDAYFFDLIQRLFPTLYQKLLPRIFLGSDNSLSK